MSALAKLSRERNVALVDVLDRLLAGGVVIGGDITLSLADVDLVYVGLRAVISSVSSLGVSVIEEARPPLPPGSGTSE
jgi:Gas vesicle protein